MDGIGNLVEDFAFGAFASAAIELGVNIIAADVSGFPCESWNTVAAEVQLITGLPRAFIFSVKVGQIGVRNPDGATAVAVVIQVSCIAGYSLVGQNESMRTDAVLCRQAPNSVVVDSSPVCALEALVDVVSFVVVEIKRQSLAFRQRHHVINVRVFLVVCVFDIGEIERST